MINLRSLLASTTNNNLQGQKYGKIWFRSTHGFLFSKKDMCLFDIICYVANPEMPYKKAGEIIRQCPNFDHIMLQ